MARIIDIDELRRGGAARFEGHGYGASVSFFVVNQPKPGRGPGLHTHPYEETFVITDGSATFTVDGEEIEGTAGMILIVPAGTPHKFLSGADGIRSVNIHGADRMVQEDLDE